MNSESVKTQTPKQHLFKKVGEFVFDLINGFLGEGASGIVYLANRETDQKECAIKIISKSKLLENPSSIQAFNREVEISKMIQSDNAIKFIKATRSRENIYLIYEYCNGGTLKNMLKKSKKLGEKAALEIAKQIIQAFIDIQKSMNGENLKIMHRDLKPDNIYFHKGEVKVGDFGFAKIFTNTLQQNHSICGSPLYMSPEILNNEQGYSENCDSWSLGVMLYEMAFGGVPWIANSREGLYEQISRKPNLNLNGMCSKAFKDLLINLLKFNDKDRLSLADAINHNAFKILDQKS